MFSGRKSVKHWRKYCCLAMLAGLLMGALGTGLFDRFPGTKTDPGTTVQPRSQSGRVQRLNADSISWAAPIATVSGTVLLSGESQDMREDLTVPRMRFAPAHSDRAPPLCPYCESALRHT